MISHLPGDPRPTLQALFEYRNKMFHCGFEWPVDEREQFDNRIKEAKWPFDWFDKATSGGKPWVFYLTDTFINHCLTMVERVIEGIGAFCRKELPPGPPMQGNAT